MLKKEHGLEIEEKKCAGTLNDYFGSVFTIVELLSGDFLQKSMKDFYTKPKLQLHSEK